jgi:hypothetical protein
MVLEQGWVRAGAVAGLVASATLALFAALTQWSAGYPIDGTYTYIAGKLAGPGADGASWAVPAGIATLILGSVAWGIAYAYAARKRPQLVTRPWISGIVFGAIVWLIMEAVQIPFGELHPLSIYDEDRNVFGLMIFFGVPIAYLTARLTRAR